MKKTHLKTANRTTLLRTHPKTVNATVQKTVCLRMLLKETQVKIADNWILVQDTAADLYAAVFLIDRVIGIKRAYTGL